MVTKSLEGHVTDSATNFVADQKVGTLDVAIPSAIPSTISSTIASRQTKRAAVASRHLPRRTWPEPIFDVRRQYLLPGILYEPESPKHRGPAPQPGAEYAVTWVMPDRTLEGQLKSRVEVIGWRIDHQSKSLVEPREFSYAMPLRIPFEASHIDIVSSKLELFREETRERFRIEYRKLRANNDARSNQLMGMIEAYVRNMNASIRIEKMPSNAFGDNIAHLITPPVNMPGLQLILGDVLQLVHYNRPQIQSEEALNYPWGIFTHDNGVAIPDKHRRVVSAEYIKNSVIVSQDSEAANWQRVFSPAQIREMDETQVREVYQALSVKDPKKVDPRKFTGLTRREMIREVDRILNATKGETLDLQQLASNKHGGVMIGLYNFFSPSVDVAWPGSDRKMTFELVGTSTAEEMISLTEQKIQDWQPLIIVGQNNFKYDFNKPVELHGHWDIGVNYRPVIQRGQIPNGFFVRKAVPGRECIDNMGFMQHFAATQSKRMDVSHQYMTGINEPKTFTHAQLPQLVASAKTDKQAQDGYLGYGGKDVLKPMQILERTIDFHIEASLTTGSSFGRIDMVAKRMRAIEYWNRRYFQTRQHFPPAIEHLTLTQDAGAKRFVDFSAYNYACAAMKAGLNHLNDALHTDAPRQLFMDLSTQDHLTQPTTVPIPLITPAPILAPIPAKMNSMNCNYKLHTQQGVFHGYWIEFFPFAAVFKDLLCEDARVRHIYDQRESAARKGDTIGWEIRSRELEAYATYPAFLTAKGKITNKEFKDLLCISDLGDRDYLGHYRRMIQEVCTVFARDLACADMINAKPPMYLVRHMRAMNESLDLGSTLQMFEGEILSGTSGRFAINRSPDHMYISPGIADPKSNKGERCEFEKSCYQHFFHSVLIDDDIRSGLSYIATRARQLANGDVLADELHEEIVYQKELQRGHEQFSRRSNAPHVKQARKQQSMKGDHLRYEYDLSQMQERLFGIVHDTLPAEDLFANTTPVLTRSGKISEVVSWLLPIYSDETTTKLATSLFAGQANESTIDTLAQIYLMTKGKPVT